MKTSKTMSILNNWLKNCMKAVSMWLSVALMKQLIGGDPIRYGLLRLQPAVAGLNLCRSGQPVMIWPVSVSR